ncbi:MAG: hypothetical protein OXL34_09595 [Gemmatimonadota bacterium]|nr:hypothetical protein [Gemmatimonadota bacterium]
MYRTCIFCTRPLGSNRVIEHFPVGRRLAFDGEKGRLWVICRKCLRWNLTPIEERWEAIEECERIYREMPVRVSTENIGIARHPGGLDLVRIGKARRREFAAWRYMQRFRRRMFRTQGAVVTYYAAVFALDAGVLVLPTGLLPVTGAAVLAWLFLRTVGKVRVGGGAGEDGTPDHGDVIRFRVKDDWSIRLLPDDGEPGFGVEVHKLTGKAWFEGEDARRVAAAVIPAFNPAGGTRGKVELAVEEIARSGHPSRFITDTANRGYRGLRFRAGHIRSFPTTTKLALEMALHEEQERRALEGELWILEQAWKEAEEIAAISDNLLLPAGTDAFFRRHGRESGPRTGP